MPDTVEHLIFLMFLFTEIQDGCQAKSSKHENVCNCWQLCSRRLIVVSIVGLSGMTNTMVTSNTFYTLHSSRNSRCTPHKIRQTWNDNVNAYCDRLSYDYRMKHTYWYDTILRTKTAIRWLKEILHNYAPYINIINIDKLTSLLVGRDTET